MLVLVHLVQCGPKKPSWIWTQTWVQAQMPDYSLNWTKRSSAIQSVKGVNVAVRQPEGSPARPGPARLGRNREPFGLKSAIEYDSPASSRNVPMSLTAEFI